MLVNRSELVNAGLVNAGMIRTGGTSYLLRDTFTDTNGVNLTAHTMDVGSGWTAHEGSWQIQSNVAAPRTAGGNTASADAGDADIDLTVVVGINYDNDNLGGPIVRLTNNSNYWWVQINGSANTLTLQEMNAGVITSRGAASVAVTTGDHTFRVVANGATITVYYDGSEVISYGSATFNQSATRHGFRSYYTAGVYEFTFDTFEVIAA